MNETVTNVPQSPPPRRRKAWLLPVLVLSPLAVGVVILILLISGGKAKEAAPADPPAVNVKVRTVQPIAELDDTFDLPAVVEPDRVVKVAAEVAGRVEKIAAEEGKPCKQGDRLVVLNTEMLQAAYNRTQAAAEFDKREFDRTTTLATKGVATDTELDQARSKHAVSKAAFDEAKAMLERSTIVAPIGGILNRVPVEAGEYVQPGSCVAEIVDIDKVKVCVDVPERDAASLKLKDSETVLSGPNGQHQLPGEITYISELADAATRTTRVEIIVDNSARKLRSGQIVIARISRGKLKDVVLIPLLAVIPLEEGKEVFVVQEDKAVARKVSLGFFRGSDVQVLPQDSELKPGDKLIISGHRFVSPGQAVHIEEN